MLPARPSVEQLRKQAKDLLRALRAGEPGAAMRFRAAKPVSGGRGRSGRRNPRRSQLVVAREHGFEAWPKLVEHVRAFAADAGCTTLGPLIRPVELRPGHPWTLPDGAVATTDDVYRMFVAARAGDLAEVKALVARAPRLALVEYDYTPPIHFAVREGHPAIVELLIERGTDVGAYFWSAPPAC